MGNSRMAVAAYTGQVVSKKTKCPGLPLEFSLENQGLVVSTQQDWLEKWWFIWKINTIFLWVNQLSYPWKRICSMVFPWIPEVLLWKNEDFLRQMVISRVIYHWWIWPKEHEGFASWRTWRMVYWPWKMVLLPRKGVKIQSIMVNLPRKIVILPWKTCDFTQTHAEFTKKKLV